MTHISDDDIIYTIKDLREERQTVIAGVLELIDCKIKHFSVVEDAEDINELIRNRARIAREDFEFLRTAIGALKESDTLG